MDHGHHYPDVILFSIRKFQILSIYISLPPLLNWTCHWENCKALKVLTMLQCLAAMGPQKLALGFTCQCVESIMRHLTVLDIAFAPEAVLGAPVSTRSRSNSLEMDMSLANISSLLSSVGSTGDMLRHEADMETTIPNAGETGEQV